MTNQQLLDLMMSRLGQRTSPTLRAKVLTELNNTIRELEVAPQKPWFLEDIKTGVLVANQEYIDLPSDFLLEIEERPFKLQTTAGKWCKPVKVEMETLEDETENEYAAFPEGYALFGSKLYLGPTPDAAYNYKLPYFKRTTAVIDDGAAVSNKWCLEYLNYTTYTALLIVARNHIQSDEVSSRLAPAQQMAFDNFWRDVEARKHTRRTYLMNNTEE